jgi:hypothetical protein
MKRDWVVSVIGAMSPPFAASKAIAESEQRSLVARVLGEDDPSPSPKDAAPRPVSSEEAKKVAKAEEAAKTKKPAPLPPA